MVFACFAAAAGPARAGFEVAERDGRIEVSDGGKVVLAWQREAMTKPGIDKKFAGSAFLAPLRTPGGFVLTDLQPSDHRHHFGVWWPWKYLEVDGRKYNCWEVQEHQGRHVAVDAKVEKRTDDEVVLALTNRKPARWAMVSGPTPSGEATMLIMSAAAKNGGKPELLRVWGKAIGGGKPFVDFNPVVRESMPLDGSHPEVSHRRYRLILADHKIQPAEAARLWKDWQGLQPGTDGLPSPPDCGGPAAMT